MTARLAVVLLAVVLLVVLLLAGLLVREILAGDDGEANFEDRL